MSPDVFLSQQGIRYDRPEFGSPAELVQNLKSLSVLRALTFGELTPTRYHTAGFFPAPVSPATFDPVSIKANQAAQAAYFKALKRGILGEVYAAVDSLNAIRAMVGGSEQVPPTDFEIVSNQPTPLGFLAREISSQRIAFEENSELPQPLIPWFDTLAAYNALNNYNG